MDEEQPWGRLLSLVRDQQERRDRFDPIKIQNQPLESVAIVFLGFHQLGWARFVSPRQVAQEAPEFSAAPGLESGERLARLRLGHWMLLPAR
jgi:hypothetical protein